MCLYLGMGTVLENMSKEQLIAFTKKQDEKISRLQFDISQLQWLLFGAKRERFISSSDDRQLKLPFETEHQPPAEPETETVSYERKRKRKNHPGRFKLPSHLPVKEIIIEPEEDTHGLTLIGKEITEELDYTRGRLHVNR